LTLGAGQIIQQCTGRSGDLPAAFRLVLAEPTQLKQALDQRVDVLDRHRQGGTAALLELPGNAAFSLWPTRGYGARRGGAGGRRRSFHPGCLLAEPLIDHGHELVGDKRTLAENAAAVWATFDLSKGIAAAFPCVADLRERLDRRDGALV
jgi:hypothetical protein